MIAPVRTLLVALVAAVTMVGTMSVLVGGPASAAQPQTGQYHYWKAAPGSGGTKVTDIEFSVARDGSKLKVRNFTWTGPACGSLTVTKGLTVRRKGKFRFRGAARAATARIDIKVTGKFTSRTKARVSIVTTDADYSCGTVSGVMVPRRA